MRGLDKLDRRGPPVVEEGALAPVSKPPRRPRHLTVVSTSSTDGVCGLDRLDRRGLPLVEEGALAPVSKPPRRPRHLTVVSTSSTDDARPTMVDRRGAPQAL